MIYIYIKHFARKTYACQMKAMSQIYEKLYSKKSIAQD